MNYVVVGKSNIPNDAEKLSLELSEVTYSTAFRIQQCTRDKRWSAFRNALNRGSQLELSNKYIAQKMGLPLKFINKQNTVAHCTDMYFGYFCGYLLGSI
jgi:hypothetical protein